MARQAKDNALKARCQTSDDNLSLEEESDIIDYGDAPVKGKDLLFLLFPKMLQTDLLLICLNNIIEELIIVTGIS